MAVTVERLIATLEANFSKYDRALNKALGDTNRTFTRIESRGKQMEARMSKMGMSIGRSFIAPFAAGVSLRGAQQLIDSATRIENALKVAGLSGEELRSVYDRLFDSAQRNAAPLEAMVTLYGRLAQSQDSLKVSQGEMTGFVDKIGVALRVSGASATEASGALLQLSQALGAGVVRAEEYNSINEGARPILQAVAAGLKEAGGDVAKLRNLVMDGKISSQAFFRAFEVGSATLEQKVAGATLTVAQQFTRLQNVMIDAAGKINDITGAGDAAGKAVSRFADIISALADAAESAAAGPLGSLVQRLGQIVMLVDQIVGFGNLRDFILDPSTIRGAGQLLGAGGEYGRLSREIESLKAQRDAAAKHPMIGSGGFFGGGSSKPVDFDAQIAKLERQKLAIAYRQAASGRTYEPTVTQGGNAKTDPISYEDYAVTDKDKKGKSKRENEFQREISQIKERTAALQAETAIMAGLNPLINDYGYAIERTRGAQELLTAAKRTGMAVGKELGSVTDLLAGNFDKLSPKAREQAEAILDLADKYALASVGAEKLAEKQEKIRDAAELALGATKDLLRDIVDGFIEGKDAAEIFSNALNNLGSKLLDFGFDMLFGGLSKGVGSIFGRAGLFDKGGYTGAGGKNEPAGVVHRGEYVFSKKAVERAGVGSLEALHRSLKGYADGGLVGTALTGVPSMPAMPSARASAAPVITYAPVIDARGADVAAVARLEQAQAKDRAQFADRVLATMVRARRGGAF